MKPPTFAPIYMGLYPVLCEKARSMGYALAVHGTGSRDLDLVACPWTEQATDPWELCKALMGALGIALGDSCDGAGRPLARGLHQAHGRITWIIPLGCEAVLDLSVMPRAQKRTP